MSNQTENTPKKGISKYYKAALKWITGLGLVIVVDHFTFHIISGGKKVEVTVSESKDVSVDTSEVKNDSIKK